jgi:predicted CXXCH cytochrome family protein
MANKACLDCHKRAGDTLSAARTPSTCHTCHAEDDLPVIHRHVMDPFARCQTCHDPHGGDRPHMLKDAREKLCIRCHEAGHSKP